MSDPSLPCSDSGDRPRGEEIAGGDRRAVHGRVRELLRHRPVEPACVRPRDDRAAQLDLELDVERPRALRAEVRERRRLLRRRRSTKLSSSSASGVTQAPIDVANDLPRNGPSGWYSHAWMSRALQSLTSTTPNTWSRNAAASHRLAQRAPDADDEAELELDVQAAARAEARSVGPRAPFDWPQGRTIGVPLTTTVPARPW